MKAVIGNSLVSKLTAKEKQYDVRDASLKGFLIRVTPTGKMSYVCQYGRGKRINIGQVGVVTPAQAREKAKKILAHAEMGVLPIEKSKNSLTLNSFLNNDYESWRSANRKNGKDDIRRLKANFADNFGEYLLADITPIHIEKWRTNRINDGVKASTINRDIIILKSALTKAIEWELITDHPLQKLRPFKLDSLDKIRYLNIEEEADLKEALFARDSEIMNKRESGNQWRKARNYDVLPDLKEFVFGDYLTPMVLLSLNTGLRRGELFSLEWKDIDLEKALLNVRSANSKSGKGRYIPLNVIALDALNNWKFQSGDRFVFASPKTGNLFNNVKRSWKNILEKAEVKDFRWHDMRHHFASKLVMAGVDLNTVRELLGHADIKMTLRYAHLAPEHKANAVAKLV